MSALFVGLVLANCDEYGHTKRSWLDGAPLLLLPGLCYQFSCAPKTVVLSCVLVLLDRGQTVVIRERDV